MKSIKSILNRWSTLSEYAKIFNTEGEFLLLKKKIDLCKTIGNGEFWTSGRHNHIWIQDAIKTATNNKFTIGGQGKKHPDMYLNEGKKKHRVELKGFANKSKIRVSASKFFGNNSGMTQLKKLKTKKEKSDHVLSNYTDDYYLLTQTTTETMKTLDDVGDIQVYLIKKSDMLPLLKDSKAVPKSIIDLSEVK